MTNQDFLKLEAWFKGRYGNGSTSTITLDGSTYTGTMYGNDECFDCNEFYQYILTTDGLYKAYYDIPDGTDIDCLDYARPYDVRPEDVQYWLDFVILPQNND